MAKTTGRDLKNWIPGAWPPGARLVMALVMALFLPAFLSPFTQAAGGETAAAKSMGSAQSESFAFDADRFEMEKNLYKLFGSKDGPAVAYFKNGTLSGQYIEYQPDSQLARVERQVRLEYVLEDKTPVVVTADSAVADLRAGRIVARGTAQSSLRAQLVRINYGEVTATSQEATLFTLERRLVLVGHPEARSRGNLLTAGEITLFLDESRVVGQGGVRVTIIQEQSGGNRSGSN
ncbi:MAG: hypothetical protein ACM3TT_01320 [Syntrophothermus sp.]